MWGFWNPVIAKIHQVYPTFERNPFFRRDMVNIVTGIVWQTSLMIPKSTYRRDRLAPRCRLITSWGWSRSQGFGCSPIKVVRELGLKRRETVWSLPAVGVGHLRGPAHSTRGPGWTCLWCSGCQASGIAG